jgi:hypothetical protein
MTVLFVSLDDFPPAMRDHLVSSLHELGAEQFAENSRLKRKPGVHAARGRGHMLLEAAQLLARIPNGGGCRGGPRQSLLNA